MSGLLQRREEVRAVIQLPPQINTNLLPVLPGVPEALRMAPLEALLELEVVLRKPCEFLSQINKLNF